MARPIMSRKKAHALSVIVLLFGLALLTYLKTWWPAIMLVIGIALAIRQYLLGKHFDMFISLFVFIGVFITVQFDIEWEIVLPVLFITGGIYIFIREFFIKEPISEVEKEENLNKEMEEDFREHHK